MAHAALSPNRVQLLTTIGHQIGIAVENARLAQQAAEVKILREVDRLRSELIANVSHELRTPLGLIKISSSSLLMDDADFDRATQQKFLHSISEETAKLERIVEHLFDLGRIESGRLRLDKQPTDLGPLVGNTVKSMAALSSRHHLVSDCPPSHWWQRWTPSASNRCCATCSTTRSSIRPKAGPSRCRRIGQCANPDRRQRRGDRHSGRGVGPDLRAFPSRRERGHAPHARGRARAGRVPGDCGSARRPHLGREPARRRQHLLLHPASCGSGRMRHEEGPHSGRRG